MDWEDEDEIRALLEGVDLTELADDLAARFSRREPLYSALNACAVDYLRSRGAPDSLPTSSASDEIQDWVNDAGIIAFDSTFDRSAAVTFGNPGGLYDLWGIDRCHVVERGFLIHSGDIGGFGDLALLGEWEPFDSDDAYREAFHEAYLAGWADFGFPPMLGQCWDGEPEMMLKALTDVLAGSDYERGMFSELLDTAGPIPAEGFDAKDLAWAASLSKDDVTQAVENLERRRLLIRMFLAATKGCP